MKAKMSQFHDAHICPRPANLRRCVWHDTTFVRVWPSGLNRPQEYRIPGAVTANDVPIITTFSWLKAPENTPCELCYTRRCP